MLSWLRTAVSLIGFGFAFVQFFEHLQQMPGVRPAYRPGEALYLGLALIICGVLALVISTWQYWWTVRYLFARRYRSRSDLHHRGLLLICVQMV